MMMLVFLERKIETNVSNYNRKLQKLKLEIALNGGIQKTRGQLLKQFRRAIVTKKVKSMLSQTVKCKPPGIRP